MGNSTKRNRGNPQVENGYVRIANELFEQIYQIPLNGSQFRIIFFIMRNTYGFNRKSWKMSAGYISRGTGLHIRTVKRELRRLEELGILTVKHKGEGTISDVGINKKYADWKCNRWSTDHGGQSATGGGGQSATGTSGQMTTGGSGQSATQHNTDKDTTDNNRQDENRESLPTLAEMGIPDDWEHLMP